MIDMIDKFHFFLQTQIVFATQGYSLNTEGTDTFFGKLMQFFPPLCDLLT